MVKEWLAFEEPSTKWSHLKKLLRKELRRHKEKTVDVDKLTLEEQGCLFSHTFNRLDNEALTPSRRDNKIGWHDVVSIVLALEEVRRHKTIAFESWAQPFTQTKQSRDGEGLRLKELSGDVLNGSEALWIEHSLVSAPDWSRLLSPGPWSEDARVQLIVRFGETIRARFGEKTSVDLAFPQVLSEWLQLAKNVRNQLPGSFLPEIIMLVEGQSEEILLPAFGRALGIDFNSLAVNLIPCGGAKQVAKQYLSLKELTNLPVIIVLDADVEEPTEIVSDSLRACDRLIVLSNGEIEDTFDEPSFVRILNRYLREQGFNEQLSPLDLNASDKRTVAVERALKARGLGTFDKIAFARVAAESVNNREVPDDARRITGELNRITNAGIKLRFQ
ncbi:MAG: ATP-dependent endonuclease [Cyanobacteria bacterium]|nr:ATP-dependent endonuclease [Cyanobacteriota bacterium]